MGIIHLLFLIEQMDNEGAEGAAENLGKDEDSNGESIGHVGYEGHGTAEDISAAETEGGDDLLSLGIHPGIQWQNGQ